MDGKLNPADVLTKYLGSDIMSEHLLRMACVMCAGRSALAPTVKREEEKQVRVVKVEEVHGQLDTCPLRGTAIRPAIPREAGLSFLSLGHQARLVTPPVWLVRSYLGGPGSASCPQAHQP